MAVYLRSIIDGGKIRLRAIEGQKDIDTNRNIQGSKELRLSNPIGTIFECSRLEEAGTYYRVVGRIIIASNVPVQYNPSITKTKKTKVKDQPINILGLL